MNCSKSQLVDERILVLTGCGMVELAGEIFIVAPGSLVYTPEGVPHTWTACPPEARLLDGTVPTGTFTMVYEYETSTAFFPTSSTRTVRDVSDYEAFAGDLDETWFPKLSAEQVVERATVVLGREKSALSMT
ncbi:hypothetical protein LTR17_014322 [Elasticomyces elasticus]|nr:hypothetical protein LTR17_014322 [Elasticomyces elasticus]